MRRLPRCRIHETAALLKASPATPEAAAWIEKRYLAHITPSSPAAPLLRARVRQTRAMNGLTKRIAALLHEGGETHDIVYPIVDGDDPDWSSWHADCC